MRDQALDSRNNSIGFIRCAWGGTSNYTMTKPVGKCTHVKRENDFTRSGPEVADEVFSLFYYLKPNLKLLLSRLRFSKERKTL